MESNVKNCAYDGCTNTILADSEFHYCEVCRSLSLRNTVALLIDPVSPLMERSDVVFHAMIHQMRPEEILNASRKIEWIYLELQKQIKSNDLEAYRRTKFAEGVQEVMNERNKPHTPKVAKKKESKKAKLLKLLGGDSDAAKELMSEDFSDL